VGTCVIVAGTYRAGTSLLARFLHESGADMNPVPVQSDWPGWHPSGSYKDKILDVEGFTGWDAYFATRPMPEVWGIKSHRLLFIPGMMESFVESCPVDRKVLIWTTRDIETAVASYSTLRHDLSNEEAREIITSQSATLQGLFQAWPEADRMQVAFPATTIDPAGQLQAVTDLIGLPFNEQALAHIRADIPKWG
jgi:hypothetical protein